MPEQAFLAFSPMHAVTVAVCVCVIAAFCFAGRRAGLAEPRVRMAWVIWVYVLQTANVVYFALPPRLSLGVSLPLHFCDLAGWFAAVALHLGDRARWLRTTLFYWGLCMCTQAFVTPTLHEGPGTLRFWLFWGSHTQIIGSALYEVIVLKYRPSWRDFRTVVVVNAVYAALILPFDALTGFNYGYIGPTAPDAPTLVDKLGPWPLRVVWMWAIVHAAFALLTVAFARRASTLATHS
ncbi:MAG: TIGR02206 family membrane protein [Planctomycetes bacterium]|nr:TIGR02206 family membrane protein [Planctomycetota bacterium]